jgi:hypothetical protein
MLKSKGIPRIYLEYPCFCALRLNGQGLIAITGKRLFSDTKRTQRMVAGEIKERVR